MEGFIFGILRYLQLKNKQQFCSSKVINIRHHLIQNQGLSNLYILGHALIKKIKSFQQQFISGIFQVARFCDRPRPVLGMNATY